MRAELALLFACHLFGDFILQNDWMQAKSRNSFVCSVHVAVYAVPFLFLFGAIPPVVTLIILIEHWLQDRLGLHLKWMKFYRQSTPDKWPVGPLCIDQAMHLSFIALVWLIAINL